MMEELDKKRNGERRGEVRQEKRQVNAWLYEKGGDMNTLDRIKEDKREERSDKRWGGGTKGDERAKMCLDV